MWQKALKPYIKSFKIKVVGVVQEQHPDRARLYAQWRQLDWPIFVDSLNLLGVDVVPQVFGIDEAGIVRAVSMTPNQIGDFLKKEFPPADFSKMYGRAPMLDSIEMESRAQKHSTSPRWQRVGDAYYLHGKAVGMNRSIQAYEKAVSLDSKNGPAHFRLGVALWRRSESPARFPGDAQAAVIHWGLALRINPNQYIWRRRIQQFGPRLDKPYNFYYWVKQARKEIRARGEKPVKLTAEPRGSEIAPPQRRKQETQVGKMVNRDPAGRIHRDSKAFVQVDTIVTPAPVRPGSRVRTRVNFRLNAVTPPWWNNEADDLAVWVDLKKGITLGEGSVRYPNPKEPETREPRTVEFELNVAPDVSTGQHTMHAYALYYVCENRRGKCRYLRQDFDVILYVDPSAPAIR